MEITHTGMIVEDLRKHDDTETHPTVHVIGISFVFNRIIFLG